MIGEIYIDGRGDPVELGAELGAGGEGSVHAIRDRPALCAKIYRGEKAAARADKIRAMLACRPSWLLRRALAWPVTSLHSGDGTFAGFVMPARRGMLELFRLIVPDERMQVAGWLTQDDLRAVAVRLARIVAGVHRAGHCVGDLKPQNILVAPASGRIVLIDTDSFQIRDRRQGRTHPSIVVTPEYAAPELHGRDSPVERTPASDAFALAVLIHQLLLGGAHPFEGELLSARGDTSVERIPGRIRRGLSPCVPNIAAIRPARGALPLELLPEVVRDLLARCFGPGHRRPSDRPTAAEWAQALARARTAMTTCPESHVHTYTAGAARCPWCERRRRTGIDLFVPGQRWQQELASRTDLAAEPLEQRLRWLRRHVRGRLAAGRVTAAERAWLEKAGAALGLGRERVARVLGEEARPGPLERSLEKIATIVSRAGGRLRAGAGGRRTAPRRVLLAAASLVVAGTCTGVLTTRGPADRRAAGPEPRPAVVGHSRLATIGNAGGAGVFLRATPSRTGERQRLPTGTTVRLTGRTHSADALEWSEVEVAERTGWVATKYVVARDE